VPLRFVTRLSKVLTIASVIVFAVSLTQDAYYIDREDPRAYSAAWMLLLIGWLGLLDGIFAWLANPVLFAAWIFSFAGKKKLALLFAPLASVFMVAFLFRQSIIVSEAPTYAKITGYGAGYWLWLTSAMLAIIAALVGLFIRAAAFPRGGATGAPSS